jgi:membrane-bound inhibitor of C-type lysozyme
MCAAVFVGACWLSLTTKAQEMPPATATPKSHRMPMMRKSSYNCDGGTKVTVFLQERNVRVVFAGKSYSMKQVEAASGTKYSDGAMVWWDKGDEGFLEDEAKGSQPLRLAENCGWKRRRTQRVQEWLAGRWLIASALPCRRMRC